MKAYKGFNQDMTCRDFQYEEGKEYHEENAELCKNGFHACERPLDCFAYYAPANSVYHEVEINELHDKKGNDNKVCGKNIKIGARLSVAKLCELQFEYVKSHCISQNTAGDSGAATAGDYGAATAGYHGAATAGYHGAATAGESGAATSKGTVSVGTNGVALCRGNAVKAKGGLGSLLVIAEECDTNYAIKEWKAAVVDGDEIKPDVWYKLENGEFVEASEEGN